MSKKTNYVQAFSPDGDVLYRIEHHCTNLMLTLAAIAYLLVNDVTYQRFCHNDEKQIDLDSNYIFADDLLLYADQFARSHAGPDSSTRASYPLNKLRYTPTAKTIWFGVWTRTMKRKKG